MVDELSFDDERPSFHLLNVGETHYPYALADEDPSECGRGSRGSTACFATSTRTPPPNGDETEPREFFDQTQLAELQGRQVRALEHLDGLFARLFDRLPFEYVGDRHLRPWRAIRRGPLLRPRADRPPKVFEVPFVEGPVP